MRMNCCLFARWASNHQLTPRIRKRNTHLAVVIAWWLTVWHQAIQRRHPLAHMPHLLSDSKRNQLWSADVAASLRVWTTGSRGRSPESSYNLGFAVVSQVSARCSGQIHVRWGMHHCHPQSINCRIATQAWWPWGVPQTPSRCAPDAVPFRQGLRLVPHTCISRHRTQAHTHTHRAFAQAAGFELGGLPVQCAWYSLTSKAWHQTARLHVGKLHYGVKRRENNETRWNKKLALIRKILHSELRIMLLSRYCRSIVEPQRTQRVGSWQE